MAISSNHLPIDLTSEQWTVERHLLTVQAAMINQITQAINGVLVLDEVLNAIALQLVDTLQVSGCLICEVDEEQSRVNSWLSVATPQPEDKNNLPERLYNVCCEFYQYYHSRFVHSNSAILLWSGYSCGECHSSGKANLSRIEQQLPLSLQEQARECGISTLLMVPIFYRQRSIGSITLHQCEQERDWLPQEIAFVQTIASHCAIALTQTDLEKRYQAELKRLESALAISEAKNQALLEVIPDLIFSVNRDGIFLDCKAAKEDTLAISASEIIGKHLHQVLPTEAAGQIWHHAEVALETNKVQVIEFQLRLNHQCHDFEARLVKSGLDEVAVIVQNVTERVQAQVSLRQINDALELRVEERTAALRAANHALRTEIVERKRIEEALRASEERFRRAMVDAPFPMMIHAEDGEVLQINQVWTTLTGYTHIEIPTIAEWTARAYGEQDKLVRSTIDRLYSQTERVDEGEFLITTKAGENRIWHFSSAPLGQLPDGRRVTISMATDITRRKQAEAEAHLLHSITQAIFESEDFHAALSGALQKVCEATGWEFGEAWVPNADSSVLECSPAWFSKTKVLEEFRHVSENLTFAPGVGLPGRIWLTQQPEWRRDVSAESNHIYLRAEIAKKAGLKAALGIPLLTPQSVLAVLVFYMFESKDEDERLIELISASTELGLMVQRKQVEGEIRKALLREKELTELKSRFVSMTSHEFRTPLTTILSSAELLEHYNHKWTEEKDYSSAPHSSSGQTYDQAVE